MVIAWIATQPYADIFFLIKGIINSVEKHLESIVNSEAEALLSTQVI
jgi:hypothetical protein